MTFNFNGEKYKNASSHQKEWGSKLISDFSFSENASILDLGCGDGVLTAQLADKVPNGKVVGVDASIGMIDEARKQSKKNLVFMQMDINHMDFSEEFDVIYSNAALHWVKDHKRLLDNSKKALKAGGVIVWSFAGYGNCSNLNQTLRDAMYMPEFNTLFEGFEWPWYMPDTEEYIRLLSESGFSEFKAFIENADRYFDNEVAMNKWIDQPCIVPFLSYIKDEENKNSFRDFVVTSMAEKCKQNDGRCFEIFRRLNVLGTKQA